MDHKIVLKSDSGAQNMHKLHFVAL